MSAATEKQESASRLFFERYLNHNGILTDQARDNLIQDAFYRPGAPYPDVGRETPFARAWRQNFFYQLTALDMFMRSYGVTNKAGWRWSRGDGMMGFLNNVAVQKCGVSTLDSWNPMDIVGVQASAETIIRQTCDAFIVNPTTPAQKVINRGILNEIMIENIEENKLLPISLKFIDERLREQPGFELSRELQTQEQRQAALHHFTFTNLKCDLRWNQSNKQWQDAQEFSYNLVDNRSGHAVDIKIQGRAFTSRDARENPQHEGTPVGAGAKLGKAAIGELRNFVTGLGISEVPTPNSHPQIPGKGETWTPAMKTYWINLYNSLVGVTIGGSPINFNMPGVSGEGTNQNGFSVALDAACTEDENQTYVVSEPKVPSGLRLTTKLWALEWLKVYHTIDTMGRFDAFTQLMYHSCKKELPGMGPFIKIAGR